MNGERWIPGLNPMNRGWAITFSNPLWNGGDFFSTEASFQIFITYKVKLLMEENKISDLEFRRNKKIYPLLLLMPFILIGCNFEKNERIQTSLRCIPKIIIESNRDSLRIGEVFEVKVSISDTTYLTVYDSISQKEKRFYPVFKVDDLLIDNNFSDSFIVHDTVDNKVVYEEFPDYRQVNLSVIFPHPIEGEGTVELRKLVSYTVVEK